MVLSAPVVGDRLADRALRGPLTVEVTAREPHQKYKLHRQVEDCRAAITAAYTAALSAIVGKELDYGQDCNGGHALIVAVNVLFVIAHFLALLTERV